MLDCIKFFLTQTVNFIEMLFTIDVGDGLSLGLVFCIFFVFLPVALAVFGFLKNYLIGESSLDVLETRRENKKRGGR